MDFYHYDVEEFWFHDGRLLLRGNNGAGKSKVLALTLPFLLDGDLSAHRVEPDGDPKKRMEWNLLLDGAHATSERTGYTWLELGRRTPEGLEEFRTLGCGMKAVSGRGIARRWFFSTTARLGEGLSLVDRTGTALTRERLIDVLGATGSVHDSRRAYRRHVDETFFRFGEDRYGALVDLLVQLRRPQLTKRPDEAALSAALTEALPPLDQQVLVDVAEAFRSLEDDRRELAAVEEAQEAAAAFLTHYRRYARAAVKRRTGDVRRAQSRYEAVGRDLARADRDHDSAEQRLAAAVTALTDARQRQAQLSAERTTLAGDPRLSSLDEARTSADLTGAAARDATDNHRRARERADRARAVRTDRDDALRAARDGFDATLQRLTEVAGSAGTALPAPPDPGTTEATSFVTSVRDAAARRRREAVHVRDLLQALADARTRRRARQADSDRAREDADRVAERSADAAHALTGAIGAHLVAAADVLDHTGELRLDDVQGVLEDLRSWAPTVEGPSPLQTAADAAVTRIAHELAAARSEAAARRRDLATRAQDLRAERGRLLAGEDAAPSTAATRTADRAGRAGAPLWRVVDFAPDVPAQERAGLEAALEASGLLDAWLFPDAAPAAPPGDAVVGRGDPFPGPSLADVLVPAVDRTDPAADALSDDAVRAALAGIARDGSGHASTVRLDGTFALGVLAGRWTKPAAQFISRSARDAARRARLAALDVELDEVVRAERGQQEQLAVLDERAEALDAERRRLPDDSAVRTAHARRASLAADALRAAAAVEETAAALVTAGAAVEDADTRVRDEAAQLHLEPDGAAVEAVAAAVGGLETGVEHLRLRWEVVTRAVRDLQRAEDDLDDATTDAADAERLRRERELAWTVTRTRLETLQRSIGAEVDDVQHRLAEVTAELGRTVDAIGAAEDARSAADRALGEVVGRRTQLRADLGSVEAERDAAVADLREFAASGIVAVTGAGLDVPDPSTPWAPTPAVAFARDADKAITEDVGDKEWQRFQDAVTTEVKNLTDTLVRRGNTASWSLVADVIVVDVRYAGRATTVHDLRADLDADAGERRRLLDAREREVLENHLVAEVASELQELITGAERQVADVNAELDRRPLSTGMPAADAVATRARRTGRVGGGPASPAAAERGRVVAAGPLRRRRVPAAADPGRAAGRFRRDVAGAPHGGARLPQLAPVHRAAAAGRALAPLGRAGVRR
ncbi:TIGR02680 family protein [Kineococcus rhizosphaerae]|uniref:TIGR02680 family protein n=1 Tax=Kineococcus rhizosphaerae TaxID=559628 RepID=UPI001B806316